MYELAAKEIAHKQQVYGVLEIIKQYISFCPNCEDTFCIFHTQLLIMLFRQMECE